MRGNGSVAVLSITGHVVVDADGEPISLIGSVQDVT